MFRFHRPVVTALSAALFTVLAGATAAPAPPQRIVSLNMCADELIIALADPGQIAGLTEWARDPDLSFYADRARTLPITHRSAEEVMLLHPDVVIGASYRTKAALASLEAQHVPMVDLPVEEGGEGMDASIRVIAAAVGHPDRGEALIATIRAELAQIGPPPGRGRVAAYYQRQGYLTGTGTLVDDMMRRVGLVNLTTRIGRPALSKLPLEQMALARPDFLLMDSGTEAVSDRGSAMLHHPLLDRVVPPTRRIYIPQALTVCGGPSFPKAVALLAEKVRAADRITR